MAYWYNPEEILPGGPCGHSESEHVDDGACLMFEMHRGTRPRYTALSVLELRTLLRYWFSAANLPRDRVLRRRVGQTNGAVTLRTLMSLKGLDGVTHGWNLLSAVRTEPSLVLGGAATAPTVARRFPLLSFQDDGRPAVAVVFPGLVIPALRTIWRREVAAGRGDRVSESEWWEVQQFLVHALQPSRDRLFRHSDIDVAELGRTVTSKLRIPVLQGGYVRVLVNRMARMLDEMGQEVGPTGPFSTLKAIHCHLLRKLVESSEYADAIPRRLECYFGIASAFYPQ